jgi:hypothetical protein
VSATEGFTVSQQKFIHSLHLFHLYFISIVWRYSMGNFIFDPLLNRKHLVREVVLSSL